MFDDAVSVDPHGKFQTGFPYEISKRSLRSKVSARVCNTDSFDNRTVFDKRKTLVKHFAWPALFRSRFRCFCQQLASAYSIAVGTAIV